MDVLDNRIQYIEGITGIKFRGKSEKEKQEFVDKYFGETRKLVSQSLDEAYKEML